MPLFTNTLSERCSFVYFSHRSPASDGSDRAGVVDPPRRGWMFGLPAFPWQQQMSCPYILNSKQKQEIFLVVYLCDGELESKIHQPLNISDISGDAWTVSGHTLTLSVLSEAQVD